jgi:hypothetical protein
MFVSGETAEPSTETTTLIEQIVQQQVQEMVCVFQVLCSFTVIDWFYSFESARR